MATHVTIDHPLPRVDLGTIQLVRWPSEQARRQDLAAESAPVLLLVEPDAPPPLCGEHEDWLREPAAPGDLRARLATMHERARCGARPVLDDGLLIHRGAWAAIPEGQVPVVELLLDRYGSVVSKEELANAMLRGGRSDAADALKTTMARLARRLDPIGVRLEVIRGRGHMLHVGGRCPIHHRADSGGGAEA